MVEERNVRQKTVQKLIVVVDSVSVMEEAKNVKSRTVRTGLLVAEFVLNTKDLENDVGQWDVRNMT
jgi:hypothetical protein